ncbi:hypothetical protein scyTo_0024002, partial [Scyliorhinus torazame]|nr:hypothetical protein [Scyliorhinus torazame]
YRMAGVTEELKWNALFLSGGLAAVGQEIKSDFQKSESATLDIAVTGVSGSGKSSFINALRGVDNKNKYAAPTGPFETTMKPTRYSYPKKGTISVWDLPGIATPTFQAKEYLETVNFHRFDFFIIVCGNRFTENDLLLAREIQKVKKCFYFIRSKIDQELDEDDEVSPNQILVKIRNNCIENLRKAGIETPKVFLVSTRWPNKFDFGELQEVLEGDLPDLKRLSFLLALPNITSSIIEKKKVAMLDENWKIAILSAAVATVPIPGLSLACDIEQFVKRLASFRLNLGLDEDSLRRLAKTVGKTPKELRSVVKSTFGLEVSGDVVLKVLSKVAGGGLLLSTIVKQIPLAGQLGAAALSYVTSYRMLQTAVNEMGEDSKRVLEKAFPVD